MREERVGGWEGAHEEERVGGWEGAHEGGGRSTRERKG